MRGDLIEPNRKWTECQNATTMSQVTAPDESIEIVQYTAQCSELSPTSDITKLCCLYLKHVNYYYANNKENPYTNGSTVKKGEKKHLSVARVRATAIMFISPCPLLPPGTLF